MTYFLCKEEFSSALVNAEHQERKQLEFFCDRLWYATSRDRFHDLLHWKWKLYQLFWFTSIGESNRLSPIPTTDRIRYERVSLMLSKYQWEHQNFLLFQSIPKMHLYIFKTIHLLQWLRHGTFVNLPRDMYTEKGIRGEKREGASCIIPQWILSIKPNKIIKKSTSYM